MKQDVQHTFETDLDGNPSGGSVRGVGLSIDWQKGPLGRGAERKEPNGAFVETVIQAAADRLEFYQRSPFKCEENHLALNYLRNALRMLENRTAKREERGVEGTHEV